MAKSQIDPQVLEQVAKHEFELQRQVFETLGWVPHTNRMYHVEGATFAPTWPTDWMDNPANKDTQLYVTWTPTTVMVEVLQESYTDLNDRSADPAGRKVPCVTVMVHTEHQKGMLVCPINGMTLQCGTFQFPLEEIHEHKAPQTVQ